MATIKSFSDLEQSKKLAGILPIKSADICYVCGNIILVSPTKYGDASIEELYKKHIIPAWSLAALINILPSRLFDSTPKRKELYLLPDLDKSYCFYRQFAVKTKGEIYLQTEGECLVDACVAMIERLHEQKLL